MHYDITFSFQLHDRVSDIKKDVIEALFTAKINEKMKECDENLLAYCREYHISPYDYDTTVDVTVSGDLKLFKVGVRITRIYKGHNPEVKKKINNRIVFNDNQYEDVLGELALQTLNIAKYAAATAVRY